MSNIILHQGAHAATREEVEAVPTPEATETWQPISHSLLLSTIEEQLTGLGLQSQNPEFGLWNNGARLFGTFELTNGVQQEDYALVVGVRNSHDKAFSAGLAVGASVFVCDNLSFSGEITIARKHTRWIERDLPRLAAQAVGRISSLRIRQEERIESYKTTRISEQRAHDILIRSVDARAISNAQIAKVLEQWRKPEHKEFKPRNAWSLFNAYTQVYKGTNRLELPRRTTQLHGLFDQVTGLIAKAPVVGEGCEDTDVRVN